MIELNMVKFNVKNPQTGEYEPLDGASQAKVQSDWNQSDNTSPDYIKNKPDVSALLSHIVFDSSSKTYYLQQTQPANPQDGDIWIG